MAADEAVLALLRGINVGGKNIIRMADLRACLEAAGFEDVRTYIQSGNAIFRAPALPPDDLAPRLEELLASTFDYRASVVLRTLPEMRRVVTDAPEGFGAEPDTYRYDAIFLKQPLAAAEAMESVESREGVDRAWAGDGVLYHARLISRASASRLNRLVSKPVYQRMTIRNWNTTTKLLGLMEAG